MTSIDVRLIFQWKINERLILLIFFLLFVCLFVVIIGLSFWFFIDLYCTPLLSYMVVIYELNFNHSTNHRCFILHRHFTLALALLILSVQAAFYTPKWNVLWDEMRWVEMRWGESSSFAAVGSGWGVDIRNTTKDFVPIFDE